MTAGNASGINDGSAALVLASEEAVQKHNLKPLARLVSWGHAGVEPLLMGLGPVPATATALKRAGLKVSDLDVVESNEAFAAQACAVSKLAGFDPAKTNPNGSGISLGHPVRLLGIWLVRCAVQFADPPITRITITGRRNGRHYCHQGDPRTPPDWRQVRRRYHVHWRWAGHCCRFRARVIPAVESSNNVKMIS